MEEEWQSGCKLYFYLNWGGLEWKKLFNFVREIENKKGNLRVFVDYYASDITFNTLLTREL